MREVAAKSANKTAQKEQNHCEVAGDATALDRCYGEIGISAVAAAARYQGTAKNPAYAPTSTQWCDRFAEAV
jgi:hypothetical protein